MNLNYNAILVNGEVFNCRKDMSLNDLLSYLEFDIKLIAVEYNYEIIAYHEFENIMLKAKDKIEIITIVGGG